MLNNLNGNIKKAEMTEFRLKWDKARKRLLNSGADLSKIPIVPSSTPMPPRKKVH